MLDVLNGRDRDQLGALFANGQRGSAVMGANP
jgi:hypothetical protein